MNKINTPLRISEELNTKLNNIAAEKEISKNKLVTYILKDYIASGKVDKIKLI